jgi:hypothetical protein
MKTPKIVTCPDCGESVETPAVDRREFFRSATATVAGLIAVPQLVQAAPTRESASEKIVRTLYDSLTPNQKRDICFDWDHRDSARGLLRSHVSNNWHITKPTIDSDYFTKEQKDMVFQIFRNIFNPDWVERITRQLRDDTNGRPWGADQNIAIFGNPAGERFEFVMTGRHLTIRCDGNSEGHVPWGGPIFHGHAASGFNERVGHPGNVFWHQALEANRVYQMLNEKQRQMALVARRPAESAVGFRRDGPFPGIPLTELTRDQKDGVRRVLLSLLEPYRREDRDEIMECIGRMGGLDRCSLAFYQEGDLGDDGEWDNWRLEGPSFVWYFRGTPHVHIWINVSDDPSVPLNARG